MNFRELHHPRAAWEATREIGRDPERQAAFANTARPGEADQSGCGELASKFCEFAAAADEARRLGRQIARPSRRSAHRDEKAITAESGCGRPTQYLVSDSTDFSARPAA